MPYKQQSVEEDLQNAFEKTRAELTNAVRERDMWNIRIMQLEQNLKNIVSLLTKNKLTRLRDSQAQSFVGVTEAIRTVMRNWGKPMTAQDVRLALTASGFDLGRFKNPSAAIANTLIRMHRAGELLFQEEAKLYSFNPYVNRVFYGDLPDVPNPFGSTLGEMMNPGWKRK